MATNQHYLVKQQSITNTDIAVPRQRCPRSYLSSNIHCPVKIRICQERRPPLHLQDSIYDLHLRMILCKTQLLMKKYICHENTCSASGAVRRNFGWLKL